MNITKKIQYLQFIDISSSSKISICNQNISSPTTIGHLVLFELLVIMVHIISIIQLRLHWYYEQVY